MVAANTTKAVMVRRNGRDDNDNNSNSWVVPVVSSAVVAATAVCVGRFLYNSTLIKDYGWEGTWRYLWEGDVYAPELRRCVNALEDAEIARSLQESRIDSMEAALDLARLESVDDNSTSSSSSSKEIARAWVECFLASSSSTSTSLSLERTLADVSHQLDKIAAQIDSVVLSTAMASNRSNELVERIKKRKKLMSKSLVVDMERCDVLMGSYQVLKED